MRKSGTEKKPARKRGQAVKKEQPVEQQVQTPEVDVAALEAIVARQVERLLPEPEPAPVEKVDPFFGKVKQPAQPSPPATEPTAQNAQILAAIPKVQDRPQQVSPRQEVETNLAALVEKQAAAPAPKPGEMGLPARKKGESTQQYTERLVDTMVAAQIRRRQEVLHLRRLGKPIHDVAPLQVFMPTRRDAAAPPAGAKLKDGWWQTWVPTKDIEGNPDPSLMKIQGMRDWDYEVVVDEGGKPIQGRLGVLMQGPPERRAARQAHTTPMGARRSQEDQFKQQIEDMNREVGHTALVAKDWSDRFGA